MSKQTCALCKKKSELQNSHIIPNSLFKKIKKNGVPEKPGQAYLINGAAKDYVTTQDSFSEHLLCRDCEQFLSKYFERECILFLNGEVGIITRENSGLRINGIDVQKLILFFTSILWRGFRATNDFYNELNSDLVPPGTEDKLRKAILDQRALPSIELSVQMLKIIDNKFGFTEQSLKDLICKPLATSHEGRTIFDFILSGYWIQIISPGLPLKSRKQKSVLEKSSRTIFCQYIEPGEDQELAKRLLHLP